jgi:hemerythrin-like domain-containing protein
MALAHNGIIRGLNSIYLQAPNLPAGDATVARDFLIYCQCWSESMHHHHDAEEAIFFPDIENITRIKGVMEQNVEQHRAFTPGFDKFYEYCKTCPPKNYDGKKLRSLVQGFAEPLTKHLSDEIESLKALDKYDSEKIRQAYRRFEKSLMATDNVRHIPLRVDFRSLTYSSIASHP